MGGGAYAQWEDGNPAWETVEEEDEAAQEELWRADEARNGEIAVDLSEEMLAEKGKERVIAANEV